MRRSGAGRRAAGTADAHLIGRRVRSSECLLNNETVSKLNLGIFNLTDKRYWQHANAINRPLDDAALPLPAQPVTNVRATLG